MTNNDEYIYLDRLVEEKEINRGILKIAMSTPNNYNFFQKIKHYASKDTIKLGIEYLSTYIKKK